MLFLQRQPPISQSRFLCVKKDCTFIKLILIISFEVIFKIVIFNLHALVFLFSGNDECAIVAMRSQNGIDVLAILDWIIPY